MKIEKTNAMRILDQKKIIYKSHSYINTNAISGMDVAKILNEDPNQVFKTLVTKSDKKINYVYVLPVNKELNLKKAAKIVDTKNIEMVKSKDLLQLTGYIHGGCSPIGMKKEFKTIIDKSATNFKTIIFSGGKIGYQIEISLVELQKVINFILEDIVD